MNDKLITQLTNLMADEDFLKNIASTDEDENAMGHDDDLDGDGDDDESGEEEGIAGDYGDEDADGYKFEKEDGGNESLDIDEKNGKGGIFDKNEDDSEVEEFMENLENEEMELDGLKLPSDAEEDDLDDADDDDDDDKPLFDDYGDEEGFSDGDMRDDYGGEEASPAQRRGDDDDEEDEEDNEGELDDVFARANENQEMDVVENLRHQADKPDKNFINSDLVNKIEQIEDEMMNPKSWQMIGEATNKERPVNSLLDVHLDFNSATKLPPTITKEVTIKIEELIKQRVLDELFDDPVLLNDNRRKRLNKDVEMDFTKSKKGLGDLYAEDIANKLLNNDAEAFLESELNGPDAPLKREIEEISKDLFQNLEKLSNFHYTPKAPKTEAAIQS